MAELLRRGTTPAVAGLLGLAAGSVGLRVGQVAGAPLFALLVAAALLVALAGPHVGLRSLRPTAIDVVFVAYVLVRVGVELLDSPTPRAAQLGTVADLAVGYAALWAARLALGRRSDLPRFLLVLVATSVPVSVLAVLQIADVPGVERLLLATTDSPSLAARIAQGRDIRATSTIGHWTNLGGYLCGMVALACLALVQARGRRRSPMLLVVLGLAVVAQLATLTFAPLLVTLLVLAVTVHRLRIWAWALAAAAVLAAVAALLVGPLVARRVEAQLSRGSSTPGLTELLPETVAFRVAVWRHQTLPAIAERPWTGWGNGLYRPGSVSPHPAYLRWVSPESEWLRVAAQAGIPAALVLIALVLLVLQRFRVAARTDRSWTIPTAYVAGLLVISCLHSHLSDRGAPLVLWVATGVVLACTTPVQPLTPAAGLPRRSVPEGHGSRTPAPAGVGRP